MKYEDLEVYAARMLELNHNETGLRPHRVTAERDRITREMQRILNPSVRRLVARKNMMNELQDEIDQHTFIAIHKALQDWNPQIATFSTHVHWKVRAELQTLQHYEFPERRRLAVPTRINFLELDRSHTGDDGGAYTLAEYLVDENAEASVEASAQEYIALHTVERVFSHHIARQMQIYCVNKTNEAEIAKHRHTLMRNRWIYISRTILLMDFDAIAKDNGISRERARQIIVALEKQIRGQLPRFCKETHEILPASRRPPETMHPDWDAILLDYYMKSGNDTRLINKEAPLPTRPDAYDPRPEVTASHGVDVEVFAELRRSPVPAGRATSAKTRKAHRRLTASESKATPVGQRGSSAAKVDAGRRSRLSQVAIAAIAGTMLSTAVTANAQSRAVPPEADGVTVATLATTEKSKVSVSRINQKGASASPARLSSVEDIVVPQPAWGIRIVDYSSAQQAYARWKEEPRSWQWLRGLRAAYIAPHGDNNRHGIAFGPLSERQAFGMCYEARRVSKPCEIVRFGKSPGESVMGLRIAVAEKRHND